jgi:hypothetical protein
MNMSIVAIIALSTAAADAPRTVYVKALPPPCQTAKPSLVDRSTKIIRPKRLDEEPRADLYLSVFRTEGGCMKPLIVRHNIGGR